MKTKLFPNYLKKVGWILLILSTILLPLPFIEDIDFGNSTVKVFAIWEQGPGFFTGETIFGFYKAGMDSILFTISLILWLAGALLVTFSKEKHEDEHIVKILVESLRWAIFLNYFLMIICLVFFWGLAINFVILVNLFALPVIFVISFNHTLHKTKDFILT